MAVYDIDVTREHCPMTFVRVKLELNKLAKGDVLNVKVTPGEPLDHLPASATEQGFKVLSVKETSVKGVFNIEIEK